MNTMENASTDLSHHQHNLPGKLKESRVSSDGSGHRQHFRLAVSATIHCLVGCGIGEVAGMIIAAAMGMVMLSSMILAIILGFVAGMALGIVPLLRADFTIIKAFKTVLLAEGLSIAVMEAFEVLTQVLIPGVMEAGLTDGIFWMGMAAGMVAGFIAALPVNYVMIGRGIRHRH